MTYSAFLDHQRHLCTDGDLAKVVGAVHSALGRGEAAAATIFADATGKRTEVADNDTAATVLDRLEPAGRAKGPGRPKLGVVSREISLLPRHWEWLAQQSGGASAALRRLVDEARKRNRAHDEVRQARDAVAAAMSVLAGDRPGYEETLRALYAGRFADTPELMREWPADLQAHFGRLVDRVQGLSQQDVEEGGPLCG